MYLGLFSKKPKSKTRLEPMFIYFKSQAFLYFKKLLGHFFLNCKAIPLPITPTQLTVFINASHLESNKLPCTSFIGIANI